MFTTTSLLSEVVIDLPTAIQRALAASPALSAAQFDVFASEADEEQASLWPNPIASVDVNDDDDCNSKHEFTAALTQLIELGGKRSSRQQGAYLQTTLALWQLEGQKLDLCNDVTKAFVEVMAAQESVKLAIDQRNNTQEALNSIEAKVEAGKVAPLHSKKASITHAKTGLALDKAKRDLQLAKKKLASLWGNMCPDFDGVSFPLYNIEPLPDLCMLTTKLVRNPDLMQADAEIAIAEEEVKYQRIQRIPDVEVMAGYVGGCGRENTWTAGIAFPLPIFDLNQGNICKAEQLLYQAHDRKTQISIDLQIALSSAYEDLRSAYNQGIAFQTQILSVAQDAFDAAREGYNEGKQDYIDLLDAQRTLFETQQDFIDTLIQYHEKRADVERLIGSCGG